MRFFFRSRQFKRIMSVAAVVLALAVVMWIIGGTSSPSSSVFGAITIPFQKFFTSISDSIKDRNEALSQGEKLMTENEELRAENDRLKAEIVEAQEAISQNDFYKDFLGIKERNPDFQMEPATLIARDPADPYGGFTVDKGSLDGIALHDPVITSSGLVGYISEVSVSYSKVTTILNESINIGGIDRRTSDAGVVSGRLDLARDGLCRLYNLSRTSSVTLGDFVVTSGGANFPPNLIIGSVKEVLPEETDISVYAVIEPAVDISDIRNVMILTYFSGQGIESYSSAEGK